MKTIISSGFSLRFYFLLIVAVGPSLASAQSSTERSHPEARLDPRPGPDEGVEITTPASLPGSKLNSSPDPTTSSNPCQARFLDWTADYYEIVTSGENYAWDVAIDGSGNAYVTGESGDDFLTIKYNSAGIQQWATTYDGPGQSTDGALAIAVDALGNVYVTGYSYGPGSYWDYATVKYDAAGVEQWVARYDGPGNYYDLARDITLDGSGNVFVTGYSYGAGSSYDIATVKYDPLGNELWAARHAGPGGGYDEGRALAVDAAGNVYVAGYRTGAGSGRDHLTVKYDTAGSELWAAAYNGPANADDEATALAIDAGGNVNVTGWSNGSGTLRDYTTIQYDQGGIQRWIDRYNGPAGGEDHARSLAVDGSANVFVTGNSIGAGTQPDYATLKYDSSGNRQWVGRYTSPGDRYDEGRGVAVDAAGNVYVTGYINTGSGTDYSTLKYNTAGIQLWAMVYDVGFGIEFGLAIALDAAANVFVAGQSNGAGTAFDYATVKYDSAGIFQWTVRRDAPGYSENGPVDIALDAVGNIFVTGYTVALDGDLDYVTIKYDRQGTELWNARYDGPDHRDDIAKHLIVDVAGNVYVTGTSGTSDSSSAYLTVKYDSAGAEVWTARYDGTGSGGNAPHAIAVNASGSVWVTGASARTISPGSLTDFATVRYDADGYQRWVTRFPSPMSGSASGDAIAVDESGNAWVTGPSWLTVEGADYTTLKYDSAGVEQWMASYDGAGHIGDFPKGIVIDVSGNSVVTGVSHDAALNRDFLTIRYNAAGVEEWTAWFDGPGGYDEVRAIAMDPSGNILVTGYSSSYLQGSADFTTVKYDPTGSELWARHYHGPGSASTDQAADVATDVYGNVYVTGVSNGSGAYNRCVTLQYDPAGTEQWQAWYSGEGLASASPAAIATDFLGNVSIAAKTYLSDRSRFTTIRYEFMGGDQHYMPRWNLVSLPRAVPDPSRSAVFPMADSPLWEFNGVYVQRDSLEAGKGYWTTFPLEQCFTLGGDTVSIDTIDVAAGWNLVGSITVPILVSQITSEPPGMSTSPFFGFDGGYTSSPIVEPGQGYWVKVEEDGKLILAATGAGAASSAAISIVESAGLTPPPPPSVGQVETPRLPVRAALHQNYPNPFNPSTVIRFDLPASGHVTLKVYDILGRLAATLVDGYVEAGYREVSFDLRGYPSGVYLYRLQVGTMTETMRMVVAK